MLWAGVRSEWKGVRKYFLEEMMPTIINGIDLLNKYLTESKVHSTSLANEQGNSETCRLMSGSSVEIEGKHWTTWLKHGYLTILVCT